MACPAHDSTKGFETDNRLDWKDGTYANGARLVMQNIQRSLAVAGFRVPNILQTTENPYLIAGDNLILNNVELVTSLRGLLENVTVTANPALVNGLYETPISVTLTGVGGATAATLTVTAGSTLCDLGFASKAKSVTADVVAPAPVLSDFSGYIYSRPLNSHTISGCVYVSNGSRKITLRDTDFAIQKGDLVKVDNTSLAVTGATVIDISSGRSPDGSRVIVAELSAPVSGITVNTLPNQLSQVTATARPQVIAPISFTSSGPHEIVASVDKSLTSSPSFPLGTLIQDGTGCDYNIYCYVISMKFPNNPLRSIYGIFALR